MKPKLVRFFDFSHIHKRLGIENKGSLQLSVNAIVILILAITLLGLGLAFIRNLFGGTVSKLQGIASQLDEEEMNQLLNSQDEITFLTSKLDVKGREEAINIAVRNVRSTYMTLEIETGFRCYDAIGKEARDALGDSDERKDKTFRSNLIRFASFPTLDLEPGQSEIVPVVISVDPSAPSSTYKCEMRLHIVEESRPGSGDDDDNMIIESDFDPENPEDTEICDSSHTEKPKECKEFYKEKNFLIKYKKG